MTQDKRGIYPSTKKFASMFLMRCEVRSGEPRLRRNGNGFFGNGGGMAPFWGLGMRYDGRKMFWKLFLG